MSHGLPVPVARLSALVVSQDEDCRLALQSMLQSAGAADVVVTADGREGRRLLALMPRPPDLIVCEVFMPQGDGIELILDLVRMQYRGGVVLVTGSDDFMLAVAEKIAIDHGLRVLDSLLKPLQRRRVLQAVARLPAGSA